MSKRRSSRRDSKRVSAAPAANRRLSQPLQVIRRNRQRSDNSEDRSRRHWPVAYRLAELATPSLQTMRRSSLRHVLREAQVINALPAASQVVRSTPRTPRYPELFTARPSTVSSLRRALECDRRAQRAEVLHAAGKTGSGTKFPRRKSPSKVRC